MQASSTKCPISQVIRGERGKRTQCAATRASGGWARDGWAHVLQLTWGMSKPIPSIQKYMTTSPHTVGTDQTLAHAHAVLREHKIRHLPVLRGGDLVGMLTDRDLALIETLKDVDPSKVLVEDAMSTGVYTVSPDTPLDQVVTEMAAKKYGSAVVVQNNRVVGIVTNVDICAAFAELLNGRLAK